MLLLAGSAGAQAAVVVNRTTDAAPAAGECSGVANDCGLRQAIDKAAVGDAVIVPSGPYTLTLGPLAVTKALSVLGFGAQSTIVQQPTGNGRVFSIASGGAPVVIAGVTITGGKTAAFAGGGGVQVASGAVTLAGVTLAANKTGDFGNGGAIEVTGGGLTVDSSTISGNTTGPFGSGGGVSGAATITNSTISANTAGDFGSGGGLSGSGTLKSVTITENTAGSFGSGGNINGGFALKNTIVSKGKISSGASNNCGGAPTSNGNNVEDLNTCNLTQPTDKPSTDPKLGLLQANGGPTDTRALLAGSPAIDAGSLDCPPPGADQRGVPRPQGSACDIGAFEVDLRQPPPASLRQPPPASDKVPPSVTGYGLSDAAFAASAKGASIAKASAAKTKKRKPKIGTTVRYTLSEPAAVTFTVEKAAAGRKVKGKCVKPTRSNRKKKRCTRYLKLKGSFVRVGLQGKNSFKFTGRLRGARLALGSYRLLATATDAAGNVSSVKRINFKIIRG
ncbi:MAG: hypothetical protein LC777_10810 [Actinobacteria bacterium]|nr:hypothetical protein [Actinomycetota bacterium]